MNTKNLLQQIRLELAVFTLSLENIASYPDNDMPYQMINEIRKAKEFIRSAEKCLTNVNVSLKVI